MPSPTQVIAGCPFASRCPRKLGPVCDAEPPPVRRFADHWIACHIDLPPAAIRARQGADRPAPPP
jgi:peptide/nickel transport system ATP-binding protein